MKMKKFDVLVVGELNVDLILDQIDSPPQMGKEILARQMMLTLGSSSAILASNLSSLGAKVAFIGKLGKDIFGDLVIRVLEEKGVDTSMIIRREELATGATIVLNSKEERAMITHPGAMDQLSISDISPEQISQAKHLHFSSCFLQPALKRNLPELFREAKNKGLSTSFDPQWDPQEQWDLDLNHILRHVDVFLPNEKELLNLTRKETIESALESLEPLYTAIIVKMGNKGSFSLHKRKPIFISSFLNENVVDAIGAGDSFNAGFLYKYIQNASIKDCQEFGNLVGAISTTSAGGTTAFKNPEQIMEIGKQKFKYQKYEASA